MNKKPERSVWSKIFMDDDEPQKIDRLWWVLLCLFVPFVGCAAIGGF